MGWSYYCQACEEPYNYKSRQDVIDSPDPEGECSNCGAAGCVHCMTGSLCDMCNDERLRDEADHDGV